MRRSPKNLMKVTVWSVAIGIMFFTAMSNAATFLYFDSEQGDYIGQGIEQIWTTDNGVFTATGGDSSNVVTVDLDGASWWHLKFSAPGSEVLQPGPYENAARWPFQSPTQPGLSVYGDGRGCNELTGRFDILELSYTTEGEIDRFAADFGQHCEGNEPALFGFIRYNSTVDDLIQDLVSSYYLNVLDRVPDQGGWDLWTSKVERIVSLGIDIREGFQALAKLFFDSAEYNLPTKSPNDFVTDLYETFLNRRPDDDGKTHWMNQLAAGLTPNMLITFFANCEEFRLHLQDILGTMSTRPENNLVNDLYRGFLGRLPDSGGFGWWLKDNPSMNMRSAQCSGAAAVRNLTNQIALAFIQSNEYTNRHRNNNQYVEDLYNGILKRGADPAGYMHWVTLLHNHTYNRVQMLSEFTNSPEFQTRVQAVIDAGCLP
jgi:hypothetical protein